MQQIVVLLIFIITTIPALMAAAAVPTVATEEQCRLCGTSFNIAGLKSSELLQAQTLVLVCPYTAHLSNPSDQHKYHRGCMFRWHEQPDGLKQRCLVCATPWPLFSDDRDLLTLINTGTVTDVLNLIHDVTYTRDINTPSPTGETPLMLSASIGCEPVVRALLAHPRINVNRQAHSGETALMLAVFFNREAVVKLLLADERVDRGVTNHAGQTALAIAEQGGNERIIRLLRQPAQWCVVS